jgi:hypothetical protein
MICLAIMLFLPAFKGADALILFAGTFATILSIPAFMERRTLTRGVTSRINESLTEITGTAEHQLSARDLWRLMDSGKPRPIPSAGIPGLCIKVRRAPTLIEGARDTWTAVVFAGPLKTGTASFDRLLEAAIGGERTGLAPALKPGTKSVTTPTIRRPNAR